MEFLKAKEKIKKELIALRKEKESRIFKISVQIEECEPIFWLEEQPFDKKIYWKDRNSEFICAGVSEAFYIKGEEKPFYKGIFKKIATLLSISSPEVRFFGGMRFPLYKNSNEWELFGNYYFFVPLFELLKKGQHFYLACNVKTPIKDLGIILAQLKKLNLTSKPKAKNLLFNYSLRQDMPEKSQWKKDVISAVKDIKEGKLVKVVLARKSSFFLKDSFNPFLFMSDIRWKSEPAYHFIIQPSLDKVFLSMSPERIYHRKGDTIDTEAVAGTRRRGSTQEEDSSLSVELKKSKKELTEHRLVSETLKEKMSSICSFFKVEKKEALLKLSYMQHLYTSFSGKLIRPMSDAELMELFYPNPAIAGYPIEEAIEKIEHIERFDRGWYSGPFGWISKDASEFVVSIRSALVEGNTIHLYSGAGIVAESDPDKEWEELNSKIQNFTSVLVKS